MDDYLPSLKKSIKTGKIGQAKTLLAQIASRPAPEKQEVLQILALAPEKAAFELLSFLTAKEHKDPEIYDRLIQLITDRAHLNFGFVILLFDTEDELTILHSTPLVRHILSNETDKELLNKIIRTAGKIKIESLIDDIAEFIFYDDVGLKTEAVKALERIGTPLACEKLEQSSKTEKCDQNILDAIQILKSKNAMPEEPCVEQDAPPDEYQTELDQLSSSDVKKRFNAIINLSEKGSKISSFLLKHLKTKDHDLLINILSLISRTIPVEAIIDLFAIINQKKIDNTIKFAAYSALEAYPELESAASVVQGVSESAMFVRLAAIRTLDKNLSDFVCAEIKTRIESGTKKGELLAETILDARAKHMIEYLMISDTFAYMASNYLARTAPIPVLDTFIDILEKRNLKSTAKKYMDLRKKKAVQKKDQMIVISSSETILNTYAKLIYSCGFSSLTFQRSQDAFEAIVSQKPGAIICDLFLNDMTGMDLAREVRGLYSKDDVPVIISTLQKNLDKELLQKELDNAGVTAICDFPPQTGQIKSWIK
ncbi:MAG: response regulator [Proteobacteria bacterium]|nr:response regulator [Pseudomonadota bacterium]MBU1581322.1 response regulator [Pseudomonadota bacterium]MBU2627187.1 response regulator [Pseudomonadota bacterium]